MWNKVLVAFVETVISWREETLCVLVDVPVAKKVGRSSFTSKLVSWFESCHVLLVCQLCYWASSGYTHL